MSKNNRYETRSEMKRLLENLDSEWVQSASVELCNRLAELLQQRGLADRTRILAWTSFFAGEVDLSPLVEMLPGEKRLYLPRSLADRSMNYISMGKNWKEELEPGRYGIPEPAADVGEPFDLQMMAHQAIVLIPGVVFDSFGNRLGRGKGYYDRFLGGENGSALIKIGVCWELQKVKSLPVMIHDVPMDFVCTEEGCARVSLDEVEGS